MKEVGTTGRGVGRVRDLGEDGVRKRGRPTLEAEALTKRFKGVSNE